MVLSNDDLAIIADWLIRHIMRNPDIMFNDECRGDSETYGNDKIDLVEVIASLYEILYRLSTGEQYHYFFHHANKIGSWVDDEIFTKMLEEHYQEIIHKEACLKIAELCNKAKDDLANLDKDRIKEIYGNDQNR